MSSQGARKGRQHTGDGGGTHRDYRAQVLLEVVSEAAHEVAVGLDGGAAIQHGQVVRERERYSLFLLPLLSVYTMSLSLSTASWTHGGRGILHTNT